jgi:hypothetical protein
MTDLLCSVQTGRIACMGFMQIKSVNNRLQQTAFGKSRLKVPVSHYECSVVVWTHLQMLWPM